MSIRVYWKRKYAYIGTEYYVTIKQISQNDKKGIFELKDSYIIGELTRRINMFEKAKVDRLGMRIYKMNVKQLADFFTELVYGKEDENIDFLEFGYKLCDQLKEEGKSFSRIKTSLNSLKDFTGGKLDINELTSRFLFNYEKYLRSERKLKRINQLGKEVITVRKPMSDHGIADYMTDIRTVFNAAIFEYNDDETGNIRIMHYPFKKYKLPVVRETAKRNISVEQLRCIMSLKEEDMDARLTILARDVFLISFYLIGMNMVDLFSIEFKSYENGRITYKRAKTRGKRRDEALISIKVESEAMPLVEKYRDPDKKRVFDFYKRYKTFQYFTSAIDRGLKDVAKLCNIDVPLSTYYARHTWATIARNKCNKSKEDIQECLNHAGSSSMKITDIYIEKGWGIIDRTNRDVLDYVKNFS